MAHAPNHYASLVQTTIERIVRRPSVATRIDVLAAEVRLLPLQLAWLFEGMTGESLDDFIRRLCFERAVHQLVHTDRPLADLAAEIGYDSVDRFEVEFKVAFATSPRLFRRIRTPRFHLPAACGIHYADGADPPLFLPVDSHARHLFVTTHTHPDTWLAATGPIASRGEVGVAMRTLRQMVHSAVDWPSPTGGRGVLIPHVQRGCRVAWDVAIAVNDPASVPPGLRAVSIPAGDVASTGVGELARAELLWPRFVGEWLPASLQRLRPGPFLEVLLDEPSIDDGQLVQGQLLMPIA